jgi:tRNA threonylcarbamoyladenosine biosynthesis protein TsaB
MIIFAIDTAGPDCAACIYDAAENRVLADVSEHIIRGHAERLPAIVEQVLKTAKLDFSDITHLAVTEGPGSFAGIRVGISFVRALALALKIPAMGISSLQAMAFGAAQSEASNAIALLDARRGEIFSAIVDPDGEYLQEPEALSIEAAMQTTIKAGLPTPLVLCGNGIDVFGPEFVITNSDLKIFHRNAAPPLEFVAKLALKLIHAESIASPKPQYLRHADAKPNQNFALDRTLK